MQILIEIRKTVMMNGFFFINLEHVCCHFEYLSINIYIFKIIHVSYSQGIQVRRSPVTLRTYDFLCYYLTWNNIPNVGKFISKCWRAVFMQTMLFRTKAHESYLQQ